MEKNRNIVSAKTSSELNKSTDFISKLIVRFNGKSNKNMYYYQVIDNFLIMLQNDNLIDKIKSNDKLNNKIYKIYSLINDKFIEKN
ncbi:hypothetical protein H9X78_16200 [Clostridium saudiense]|nr:hypothetical protein [Clostridium saudiense]